MYVGAAERCGRQRHLRRGGMANASASQLSSRSYAGTANRSAKARAVSGDLVPDVAAAGGVAAGQCGRV